MITCATLSTLPIHGRHPTTVQYYEWKPVNHPPRAVIQLVHGMVEYLGRYDAFARYLNDQGYAVVGADHRGHGLSANEQAPLGYFGKGVSWDYLVEDVHIVRTHAHKNFPNVPYVIFGHSMGSFMVRDYLTRHAQGLAGAAIIGTGTWPGITGSAGLTLAKALSFFAPKARGVLLNLLAFGPYAKPFEHRTVYDWLSRNKSNVDAYIADPLCGHITSNAFFVPLLTGLRKINQPAAFRIREDLPLYIASGECDPVGGKNAVTEVAERYRRAGNIAVTTHIYAEDRHEIFNETDRDQVWADFTQWLSTIINVSPQGKNQKKR